MSPPPTTPRAPATRPLRPTPPGLSLVEVSCTLALAAILATMAVPSLGDLLAARRLDASVAMLAGDLRLARALALALGEPVRWSMDQAEGGSCYVVHRGSTGTCRCASSGRPACDAGVTALRHVHWPAADRVVLQGAVRSIVFEPQFGSAAPTATLQLHGARGRVVHCIVNLMGRVRTCAPSGAHRALPAC